ncbi:R.Pab1 family restriction endonuclease [Staphylothermus hellenicus]|nr:R.Pab1 family restriction endonuclease [Staphylothermus hellenicus]
MVECEVRWEDGRIVGLLPITLPTSKVRVKRNGEPIPARQTKLREDDLLEWQISYKKDEEVLIEAGKMLEIAYNRGIITREELKQLRDYAVKVPQTFDKQFKILKEETNRAFLGEFKVFFRHIPIIHKDLDNGCFVEAELKHKQRAVGYQPMLYVFIPVRNVVTNDAVGSLVGRTARPKEVVKWFPTKNDIIEIMKTFAVLSQKHREDVIEIIERIISKF